MSHYYKEDDHMAYQLQVFDHDTGAYQADGTGDDPLQLLEDGRLRHARPCRAVDLTRGGTDEYGRPDRRKPLPLKPKSVYRRPPKYKPGTMIEPTPPDQLLSRVMDYYETKGRDGKPLTVHYWNGSVFGHELRARFKNWSNVTLVGLDPDEPGSAFGPDLLEELAEAA